MSKLNETTENAKEEAKMATIDMGIIEKRAKKEMTSNGKQREEERR